VINQEIERIKKRMKTTKNKDPEEYQALKGDKEDLESIVSSNDRLTDFHYGFRQLLKKHSPCTLNEATRVGANLGDILQNLINCWEGVQTWPDLRNPQIGSDGQVLPSSIRFPGCPVSFIDDNRKMFSKENIADGDKDKTELYEFGVFRVAMSPECRPEFEAFMNKFCHALRNTPYPYGATKTLLIDEVKAGYEAWLRRGREGTK